MPAEPQATSARPGGTAIAPAARFLAIVLACAWVYSPALTGGWIWDDFEEVASNPALRSSGGLAAAWLGRAGSDYFPLKTTFQWVEWHLWGDATLGYHVASVALHVLAALLLWRVLAKLGVREAWLGGLVFAVHPVAVESVAWVAELKNTLSLPALLLAIGAYMDFDRHRKTRDLMAACAWFAAAMLCKSSVVMLPFVILLLCWWRRGRIGAADLKASAPFFGIALALGLVTVWFQEHRAAAGQDLGLGGIGARGILAARALVFYAQKCVLPTGLMPAYPRWAAAPDIRLVLAWLGAAVLAAWAWRRRSGWGRHALLGAGSFALNLAPVLGLVPMAYLRISWVADHFAYISLAAAAGLAAAGFDRLLGWVRWRATAWCAAAAVLAALAFESRGLAAAYAGDEAFWAFAASRNPGAWIAHDNLGLALYSRGDLDGAVAQYREALRINPGDDAAHVNLGNALARTGRAAEAQAEYREAIRIRPDDTDALTDLGNLALSAGRFAEAARDYGAVLRLRPADRDVLRGCAEAHYRGANELANSGRLADAVAEYGEALRLWPDLVQARANLGLAYSEEGRSAEALAQLGEAVREKPESAEAQAYLGLALVRAGRPAEAVPHYEEALLRNPASADLHYNLAVALKAAGRPADAQAHFEAAARLGAGH